MKRAGLLCLLLALALSTEAEAQSPPPSAEATPLYAPEDMAFQVPRSIGEVSLTVEAMDAVSASGGGSIGAWQDLLIPMGKEPADVRAAIGKSSREEFDVSGLTIVAQRIDGTLAESWAEAYLRGVMLASASEEDLTQFDIGWRDIDGRTVLAVSQVGGGDVGVYLYPKGEVLFVISLLYDGQPPITVEDVLTQLP